MYFKLKEYKLDDSAAIMVLFTDAQVFFRAADLQRMFAVTTISRPLSQCSGEIYSFTQLREKFSPKPAGIFRIGCAAVHLLDPGGRRQVHILRAYCTEECAGGGMDSGQAL